MKTVFCLQKITFSFGEEIIAKIYGRTLNNKKICLFERAYDYFLIDLANVPQDKVEHLKLISERTEIFNAEINDSKSKFIKIYTRSLEESKELVNKINDEFSIFENDLDFEEKFLLEKNLKFGKNYEAEFEERNADLNLDIIGDVKSIKELPENIVKIKPKILFFDIETFDDGKGINFELNPILMISTFIDGQLSKTFVAKSYNTKRKDVEICLSESEILEEFLKLIKEENPDIISGYNIKGFDIPYIKKRCEIYNIETDIGTDYSNIKEIKSKIKFQIEGIQIFDMYEFLKKIMRNAIKSNNLKLDSVAKEILGRSKDKVELNELSLSWLNLEQNPEIADKFVNYCLNDSILVKELYDYFNTDLEEFILMLNSNIEKISNLSFSQIVESYLIKNSRENNQIIPNKPTTNEINLRSKQRLKGAFVFEPTPGFYKKIIVFDFRSLYPSIIQSHNIAKGMISIEEVENSLKVPDHNFFIKQKPPAFIPKVIGSIIERRGRLKALIKESTQKTDKKQLSSRIGTLKLISNSLYGYLGFYMARWYSFECAESVTSFGRYYIKKTINHFKEKGFNVIYSDTDSIFIELKNKNVSDAEKETEKINSELPGLMHLELEKVYKSGIFVTSNNDKGAKKRYALIDKNNKFKIIGMEYIRGDWSQIAKSFQMKILNFILIDEDIEGAIKFVKKEIKKINKHNKKDFIIKTRLTKPIEEYGNKGPHVLVAEQKIKKGKEVRIGEFIEYIIVKGSSKRIGERAKDPEDVDSNQIDEEYYISNQIIPVIENLFSVFNINIKEEIEGKKQQGLDEFF